MLRALLFLLLAVINIAPAAADGYRSKDLAEAAAQYRQALIAAVPAEQRQPELISQLRRDADADPREAVCAGDRRSRPRHRLRRR